MSSADLIAAIDLPASAIVNQRVPKTLLVKNGAPTVADKRRINEGIEEVRWLAAIKPTTGGVPEYRDATREYLEIEFLFAVLRPGAKTDRIAELIHRAIPYPVFLITDLDGEITVSLAHKRWSQAKAGEIVLDGTLVWTTISAKGQEEIHRHFLKAVSMVLQPRTNIYNLYQGWIDTVLALEAAKVTGAFRLTQNVRQAAERHEALLECERLEAEIARIRATAKKERQIARQVDLNLELKQIEQQLASAREKL